MDDPGITYVFPELIFGMYPAYRQGQMDIFIDKRTDIKMVFTDWNHLNLLAFLMKITAELEDKAFLPPDRQGERFITPVAGNPYLAFEIKMEYQQVFFFLNDQMQMDPSIPYLRIFKIFKERIINFKVKLMRSDRKSVV